MRYALFISGLSLAACGGTLGTVAVGGQQCQGARPAPGSLNTGPLPAGCVKVGDDQLGTTGIPLLAGTATVTMTHWTQKDGEPGEYVGFAYDARGTVFVSVKAGAETFVAPGTGAWVNPNGTSGPEAKGISSVVFCGGNPPSSTPPPQTSPPAAPPPASTPAPTTPTCTPSTSGAGSGSGGTAPASPGTNGV